MRNEQLLLFQNREDVATEVKPANVASVPQRSPFRYPGGKTWLVPIVRQWLRQDAKRVPLLVEPFAGGGIVSLTAAFEDLAEKVIMSEIDPEVAAVWEVMLNGGNDWLAEKISRFDFNLENVQRELTLGNEGLEQLAFCTILKNRVLHGGIIAKGSGLIRNGENGKGLGSRWYPKTLSDRIRGIKFVSHKIDFFRKDAFDILEKYANNAEAYFFIDPPYTVAGKRLYTHFNIDHERLFESVAKLKGRFLLTYDDTEEVRSFAAKFQLPYKLVPMKTTHHLQKNELLISDNINW